MRRRIVTACRSPITACLRAALPGAACGKPQRAVRRYGTSSRLVNMRLQCADLCSMDAHFAAGHCRHVASNRLRYMMHSPSKRDSHDPALCVTRFSKPNQRCRARSVRTSATGAPANESCGVGIPPREIPEKREPRGLQGEQLALSTSTRASSRSCCGPRSSKERHLLLSCSLSENSRNGDEASRSSRSCAKPGNDSVVSCSLYQVQPGAIQRMDVGEIVSVSVPGIPYNLPLGRRLAALFRGNLDFLYILLLDHLWMI